MSLKRLTAILQTAALLCACLPAGLWAAPGYRAAATEGSPVRPPAPVPFSPEGLAPLAQLGPLAGEAGLLLSPPGADPALLPLAGAAMVHPAVEMVQAAYAAQAAVQQAVEQAPKATAPGQDQDDAPGALGGLQTLSERVADAQTQDAGGARTGVELGRTFDLSPRADAPETAPAVSGDFSVRGVSLSPSAESAADAALLGPEPDDGKTIVLTAAGTPLKTRLLLNHEHETDGLMGHTGFPSQHDAYLYAWGAVDVTGVWYRDMPATDLLWLKEDGTIHAILHEVPAVGPSVLWPDVPIYESEGASFLALPPGRARALGLELGARISGLEAAAQPIQESLARPTQELLDLALAAGPGLGEAFVEYLRFNPEQSHQLDEVLRGMNREIAAARSARDGERVRDLRRARAEIARAIMTETALEHRGQLEAIVSLAAPWTWFKGLPWYDKLLVPWILLLGYPDTYFHEGGHAVADWLIGRKVTAFRVGLNASGYVSSNGPEHTDGGWRGAFVSVAGPLGQLVFAAIAATAAWLAFRFGVYDDLIRREATSSLVNYGLQTILYAFYALTSALGAVPSGGYDWYHAAGHMRWDKLSMEMRWRHLRRGQGAYGYLFGVLRQGLAWTLLWPSRKLAKWSPAEPKEFEGEGRLY